jgi:hypothetical protein
MEIIYLEPNISIGDESHANKFAISDFLHAGDSTATRLLYLLRLLPHILNYVIALSNPPIY